MSFATVTAGFTFGQMQRSKLKKSTIISLLQDALQGTLELSERKLHLLANEPFSYYSEMLYRERWFSDLHLQVSGIRRQPPDSIELATFDNALRASSPPFDGLADLTGWLGIRAPDIAHNPPSITIRVGPPVDLMFDECRLAKDEFTVTLHAHPRFDVSRITLSVRATPGVGLTSRQQIASHIKWGRVRNGRRPGVAHVRLERADNVLAMLQIENSPVRRQWFIDPDRARNNRLAAVQHYDKELRMLRQAVLESTDSNKFEKGIAALLFLLGFTPALQIESDAPDLILTTPDGKLVIVECTMRIADFGAKVGKLVDRRGSLSRHLSETGHMPEVIAVLVCRLPRDQIAAHERDLRTHRVILISGEDIDKGLERVRAPSDPDEILRTALTLLEPSPILGN
jgi:hypothetical protein